MKRSSRSTPTGPGSRGGRWHEPAFRIAWKRQWRIDHPEYRERERLRVQESRRRKRLERDRLQVDLLNLIVRKPTTAPRRWFARWLAARIVEFGVSYRQVAAAAGCDKATIGRLLSGKRDVRLLLLADLASVFGYRVELVRA